MAFLFTVFGDCKKIGEGAVATTTVVSLTASVGRGGRNLRDDVVAVQRALNQIGRVDGGPSPLLVTDGIVGPKTTGAIERFQRTQFPQIAPDARVDPDQKTVSRLNELLSGKKGTGGASTSRAFLAAPSSAPSSISERLALAERLARDAERRILAAIGRLNRSINALAKASRNAAEQELVREIDWHFKASADPQPSSHMAKVAFVFGAMLTAVREQNLGIRQLFRAGTHPDPNAIAAAELGGFFSLDQDKRFIIITPQFRTQSSAVIVHELAHFCGGSPSSGSDVVHRASPRPPPNGTRKEDGSTDYRGMSSFQARTNVFSYQIYCFPELVEFRVPKP